ncbi:hypothetical protein H9P43_000860 [Blastocladiella emersonii ATCC 22665]|nr:hypothetical protein H9P43_000860 [Blastocladiella emersonii ATCC 22665]
MARRISSLASLFGSGGLSQGSTRPPSYATLPGDDLPSLGPPPYLPCRDPTPEELEAQNRPAIVKPTLYPPRPPARTVFQQVLYPTVVQKKLIALAVTLLLEFLVLAVEIHLICRNASRATCSASLPRVSRWIDRKSMGPALQNAILLGSLVSPFALYALGEFGAARKWWPVRIAGWIQCAIVFLGHGYYSGLILRNAWTLGHVTTAVFHYHSAVPEWTIQFATVILCATIAAGVVVMARFLWCLHVVAVVVDGEHLEIHVPGWAFCQSGIVEAELVPIPPEHLLWPTTRTALFGCGHRTLQFFTATKHSRAGRQRPQFILSFDAPGLPGLVDDWLEWNRHLGALKRLAEVQASMRSVNGGDGASSSAVSLPGTSSEAGSSRQALLAPSARQ